LGGGGGSKLRQTRLAVARGWDAIGDMLRVEGQHQLADEVGRFVSRMEPARTEIEWLARGLIELAGQSRSKVKTLAR
jgi:hypothetical protein